MSKLFQLHAPFPPAGGQPEAITQLLSVRPGKSTLVGVTGSGKTYTMAHVIAQQDKPVLVLAPNKTLAAQLYEEFSLFFPQNKVCYFVSYYDYYQPESYLPAQDIYIPKETKINSEIERLRVETTASLIGRRDVIVIASVSSIYSLGNPNDYRTLSLSLHGGQSMRREDLIRHLIFIQYHRNEVERSSGTFQVLGNTIEIQVPYRRHEMLRVELDGGTVERLQWVGKHNNTVVEDISYTIIFPARHFVSTEQKKSAAIARIKIELEAWVPQLDNPIYKERISTRVAHDVEKLREIGYCSGIENYSVYFDGRKKGEPPFCLLDFFPQDFLLIIDESHVALPQLKGMYAGDRARKKSLVDFGFRLPSAFDNRPLMFEEVERYFNDVIFVSATPGDYEIRYANQVVEQIIRPTGLLDPVVHLHARTGQMEHLVQEIQDTAKKGYRSLVMVLTKRLAEDLARYLEGQCLKVCYLHSDLKTPQRTELLQKLRLGIFDCLVGVNLLREGIDLPEVALVAIMDADVESFLRDKRSLIQIMGRAARNTEAKVVLYADRETGSMHDAIVECERRRSIQEKHNKKFGITPWTVRREVTKSITNIQKLIAQASYSKKSARSLVDSDIRDSYARLDELETRMLEAAERFDFEKAIELRAEWNELKNRKKAGRE